MKKTLIVTALEHERDAVLARLGGTKTTSLSDGTQLWTGRHAGREVVVVCFFGMGNVHSGAATAKLLPEIQPTEVILVGICGGLDSDESQFGDVVVATNLTHYEPAKETEDRAKYRPQHENCSQRLVNFARQAGEEFSGPSDSIEPPDVLPRSPKAMFGAYLTGEKVIANKEVAAELSTLNRNAAAVEMESFGVARAAASDDGRPEFLLVKSICDFVDASKGDDWQPFQPRRLHWRRSQQFRPPRRVARRCTATRSR